MFGNVQALPKQKKQRERITPKLEIDPLLSRVKQGYISIESCHKQAVCDPDHCQVTPDRIGHFELRTQHHFQEVFLEYPQTNGKCQASKSL